jgi:hypothetical protein
MLMHLIGHFEKNNGKKPQKYFCNLKPYNLFQGFF